MAATTFRVVIDTNTVLRGIVGRTTAAARLMRATETRALVVLLSKPVADEYRFVLNHPEIASRYPGISPEMVEVALSRMRYLGEYYPISNARFVFPRDPHDAKLIELAIIGRATHIVTSDKDLLSLSSGHDDLAKRFRQRLPNTEVLSAGEFMRRHAAELHL